MICFTGTAENLIIESSVQLFIFNYKEVGTVKDISRRTFLKGVAGTSTALGLGLLGVHTIAEEPAETPATEQANTILDAKQKTVFAGTDHTYGSYLNPQEDFTQDSGDYSAIFSPLKIGGVTLKNRLVKSSAGSEMQKDDFWPSDTALEYYGAFARGGIGMACFEASNVIPKPAGLPGGIPGMPAIPGMPKGTGTIAGIPTDLGFEMHQLDISTDEGIAAHKAIADYMHKHDTPVIAQVLDMLMMTGGGSSMVKAEKLETSMNPGLMQSTEEVHRQQQAFIQAAIRYWKAGFDGIEINCSCNHYFSTFLSRYANNERTDEYSGATIENRCRIVTEIIEAVRREVGNDFIIQVLYSGIEENVATLGDNALCITTDEACEMAKLFEKAGASSLHIRSQAYGHHCAGFMPDVFHMFEHGDTGYGTTIDYSRHFDGLLDGSHQGYGALIEVAAKVKKAVSIPVGAVGAMDPRVSPDLINNAIRDGKIDFILMTRPLMADMSLPNKIKEGRIDEVAPCTRCMTCFVAPFGFGIPMYCRVNPALTRAFTPDMPEGYDPLPAEDPKNVIVIGGGPAGMEAARIAAQRGHIVSLYEKDQVLGGRLDAVQKIKGPHERIEDYRKYLVRQLEVNGVHVHLGKEMDAQAIKALNPDAVIVAVGGSEKAEYSGVITMNDLCREAVSTGTIETGERVVILGGQFQACEVAVNLVRQGKKVTILNPGAEGELYLNGAVWAKMMGSDWLRARGVKIYHSVKISGVSDSTVTFDTNYGTTVTIPADTVIQATPFMTNRELFDSLSEVCPEVYAVGDCYSPNTIANATARANIIARRLGNGGDTAKAALKENQYTATATGIGDVQVTITVEDGKIVDVIVDTSNETAGIGRDLGDQFAKQIMEGGSVDAVSGATLTSDAVSRALATCKELAGIQ